MNDIARRQLLALRDATIEGNGVIHTFVETHAAFSQYREVRLENATKCIELAGESIRRLEAILNEIDSIRGTFDGIEEIKRCKAEKSGRLNVITVASMTYATAHEAVYGSGDFVLNVWNLAGRETDHAAFFETLERELRLLHPFDLSAFVEDEYYVTLCDIGFSTSPDHTIPAEFRMYGKADGEPLSAPFVCERFDLKSHQLTRAFDSGKLTRRQKFGTKTYHYLHSEIYALADGRNDD